MANWTLATAIAKTKFFLRPINASFYTDSADVDPDQAIIDLLNEGIADMCVMKAPYMLWDNHDDPCLNDMSVILDDDMVSIKRVELLTSETDTEPRVLRRPEDYDIHEVYLEFTEAQTGVVRILATRRPSPLALVTDVMPFCSPFQLGPVYYAVGALALSGGNAGVALSDRYMTLFQHIKVLWENQTMNESTSLRAQGSNPANDDDLLNSPSWDFPRGRIEL